jgi:hypothetical protein
MASTTVAMASTTVTIGSTTVALGRIGGRAPQRSGAHHADEAVSVGDIGQVAVNLMTPDWPRPVAVTLRSQQLTCGYASWTGGNPGFAELLPNWRCSGRLPFRIQDLRWRQA